jgi:hypothetical protein
MSQKIDDIRQSSIPADTNSNNKEFEMINKDIGNIVIAIDDSYIKSGSPVKKSQ